MSQEANMTVTQPAQAGSPAVPGSTATTSTITAIGLANSPNYIAEVKTALQQLNLTPAKNANTVLASRTRTFTFINAAPQTLWVGAAGNSHGKPLIGGGGWIMAAGSNVSFAVPMPFTSARFWARPVCADDPNNPTCGVPTCTGPQQTSCTLAGGAGLTTLFEINMGASGSDLDFYDISNVDAYNVPIAVIPVPQSYSGANPADPFSCGSIVFASDLNMECPPPLQMLATGSAAVVSCRNQCGVAGLQNGPPCSGCVGAGQCVTNADSLLFKSACPGCYSFPYDDATSTYACLGADYQVVFGTVGKAHYTAVP